MELEEIMENLGWPVGGEAIRKAREKDEGWYFWGRDVLVGKNGKVEVLGKRVERPRAAKRIMALYDLFGKKTARLFLELFRWEDIRPTIHRSVFIGPTEVLLLDDKLPRCLLNHYDPVEKRFMLAKKKVIVFDPEVEVHDYYCGAMDKERIGHSVFIMREKMVEYARAPFGPYLYGGLEEKVAVTRVDNYVFYEGDSLDSATIVYGPWIKAGIDNDDVCKLYCKGDWDYKWHEKFVRDFERPGWVYDGKNYRKRRGQLFIVWDGEDHYWLENGYGVKVREMK